MHLLCNAYWLDTDSTQGCDLPIIKDTYYGFNQNTDVVATLPPSPLDNFCASAKHNSSPNTYSIDSASLISSGSSCSGAGGSVQTASTTAPPPTPLGSFATYNATKATEECNTANETAGGSENDRARALVKAQERMEELNLTRMWSNDKLEENMLGNKGIFAAVDQDGNPLAINGNNSVGGWNDYGYFAIGDCDSGADFKTLKNPDEYGPELWLDGREMNQNGSFTRELTDGSHKIVFVGGELKEWLGAANQAKRKNMKYNFETGTWSNDQGGKFKNGERDDAKFKNGELVE